MIALDIFLAFVAATALLMVIPGPNVALIVANSVAHGTRFGLLTVAGTASGVVVQLALAILGASEALDFLAASFDWLRWARAAGRSHPGAAAGALGAHDLPARFPGLPHQPQDAAVLRLLPAAVRDAGSRC